MNNNNTHLSMPCPFCGEDLCRPHDMMGHTRDTDEMTQKVTLCVECGEPLIFVPDGFRKPSEDEYVELYRTDAMRRAREVFLAIKTNNERHVTEEWKTYANSCLTEVIVNGQSLLDDDAKRYFALMDVFFSGASAILALVMQELDNADSRDKFADRLLVFQTEIRNFAAFRKGADLNTHEF
jgi:hypothetical protein